MTILAELPVTAPVTVPVVLPEPRRAATGESVPRHPLTRALGAARAATGDVLEANTWSATDDEILAALSDAVALRGQSDAILLGLVREVALRDLHSRFGMPDTLAVLRRVHGHSRQAAKDTVGLASSLGRHPVTEAALRAGELSADHAKVIIAALSALPATASASELSAAEALLVDQATHLDPTELAACGKLLAEKLTITPDADDPAEKARVEAEAQIRAETAYAQRGLTIRPHHTGLEAITLLVPPEIRATLITALDPLARPEPATNEIRDTRTLGQRRVDALTGLLHLALNTGQLPPPGGGLRPHITVTIDYETLLGLRNKAAVLDDGTPLPPSALRRLLCDAEILPVVLSGDSIPLDLGRTRRTYTHHQRRALAARDKGCVFPGCSKPPSHCEAHHTTPWSQGGSTNLDQGALLCPHHHDRVHREHWQLTPAPNGHPQLIPPPTIDPRQQPRQHARHHLIQRR
jgi:hypothetical protein